MRPSRVLRHATARSKRRQLAIGFNIVTLMDIFTILVFFLLVNSGDVYQQSKLPKVSLPASMAREPLTEGPVVTVRPEEILFDGRRVELLSDGRATTRSLSGLMSALRDHNARRPKAADAVPSDITVVGDRSVSYALLQQVMEACRSAGYASLHLAVIREASS